MSETMSYEDWEALSDDQGNASDLATEIGHWKAQANQYRENQRKLAETCPSSDQEEAYDTAMAAEIESQHEAENKEWELRDKFTERFGFDIDDLNILEDEEE